LNGDSRQVEPRASDLSPAIALHWGSSGGVEGEACMAAMAMGERARESVKERFLTIRLLEQYLDLLIS
jgi:hypothetical protein